ncbi:unnamed protein product, partial [Citrullus colocynthis]
PSSSAFAFLVTALSFFLCVYIFSRRASLLPLCLRFSCGASFPSSSAFTSFRRLQRSSPSFASTIRLSFG